VQEQLLDLGDRSVVVTISTQFDSGDVPITYALQMGLAQVGRALVIVSFTTGAEPIGAVDAESALAAAVAAL
jgi:hypothetical protein